jgi:hypothetical protein
MKTICIILLAFAALMTEVQLFKIWYLPNMDLQGIEMVYFVSFICRCLIYLWIIVGYDYLWVKYITHNTVAYRKGLIKLYQDQKHYESNSYMVTALNKALLKLENGDNPTEVEDYVVRMEKQFRKGI